MTYDYQAPPESYFATTMQENDDLRRCLDESPHVVTFWNAVCAFIDHEREHGENPDRVLECPSWGQWRSIGQHFVAGRKVQAIKLLRASTCAWIQVQPALPANVNSTKWRAFMAANALPAWDYRGGLTLSEAKSIIDTIDHVPHWFGNDVNRVFNPAHVTCAEEPKAGGHVPEDPERPEPSVWERIRAMREEPPREDPERPEHNLWLNVYPDSNICAHTTRKAAYDGAIPGRIACINITYKEGEGL